MLELVGTHVHGRPTIAEADGMPINAKGREILSAMRKQYGAKKGTSVFYASINKGKVRGVEGKRRPR